MKKFFIAMLSFLMFITVIAEGSENAEKHELAEGEILMHGYIGKYVNYYIGVPAEWAIIGSGSTEENLREGSSLLDEFDVYGFAAQLKEGNDILYCRSEDGKGLILTYGESIGLTNDVLVEQLDEFKKSITESCPGVTFDSNSGSYTYNNVFEMLYIGMNYKSNIIRQYYLVTGTRLFMFTFYNTDASIAETVLSTFSVKD